MNGKKLVTVLLLAFVAVSVGYLVMNEARTGRAPVENGGEALAGDAGGQMAASAPVPQHKVVAYYFHNTQRCVTCLKIEEWSEAALRNAFPEAFADGEMEWRAVNMEEPQNEHFVDEYDLAFSTLVLVDFHEGVERAWAKMDDVWELVHEDQVPFDKYVVDQAREYLESQS